MKRPNKKRRWIDRHLSAIVVLVLLAVSMFLGIVVLPVYASIMVTHTGQATCQNCLSRTVVLTVDNVGDAIYVTFGGQDTDANTWPGKGTTATGVTDTFGNTFTSAGSVIGLNPAPAFCNTGGCEGASIWSAQSVSSGTDTITITVANSDTFTFIFGTAMDAPGGSPTAATTASGACLLSNPITCTGSGATTSTSNVFGSNTIKISAANFAGTAGVSSPAGWTAVGIQAAQGGASEYSLTVASPTNYPWNQNSNAWVDFGAVFGASIGLEVNILNMDLVNYLVVPYNKFYNFNETAVGTNGANVDLVKWKWTDGASTAEVQYSNLTKTATVLQGDNIITIGTPTATSSIVGGQKRLQVIIPVRLSANALDTTKVSIQAYALDADGISKGYLIVRLNYFNIFNQGGTSSTITSGTCAPYPIGFYSALCQQPGWIETNTTWFNLQSYHAEFAINLNDNFGNPDTFLFQDFANSNGGAEHYTAHKDWKIDVGWFYYSNGVWMKAFHMVLSMQKGNQGVQDQWTQINAEFYNGKSTLISNQTFNAWIEQSPRSQIRLYVDLWISNLNASSLHASRAGAYYYAIHQSGFTFFGTWSPFLQNSSSSMAFAKNLDSNGKNIPAEQISFSKLYYNISRGHQPVGQANFQVFTRDFNLEQFKTTKGPMAGVDTPIFVDAKIPTLPVDGFLGPLYAAITSIGDFIWGALAAAFSAIWAQIGARFPWFTGFWGVVGGNVVNFANLFIVVMGQLGGFLSFLFSIASFITYPIQIVVNAWNILGSAYNGVFLANNGPQIIGFFIILVFGLSVLEASVTGDWPFIINLTRQAWRIADAIMRWTYWFARVLIDAVLAIIP